MQHLVCTHCGTTAPIGHTLPPGWEYRLVQDPIKGTKSVRSWYATLCPDCAKKEQEQGAPQ